MKKILPLLLLSLFVIIACKDDSQTPIIKDGDTTDNQIKVLTADIGGDLNFKFESQSFSMNDFTQGGYSVRQIKATQYIDTVNVEINITINNFNENTEVYDFSTDQASVFLDYQRLFMPQRFDQNISGKLAIVSVNNDHISAIFNFKATAGDSKSVEVTNGIINYTKE